MLQILEKPKPKPKFLKPSEVLYDAYKKGIKQIKWVLNDGKGGFCAIGIMINYSQNSECFIPSQATLEYLEKYRESVSHDNDVTGLTFKEFGDRFAAIGL